MVSLPPSYIPWLPAAHRTKSVTPSRPVFIALCQWSSAFPHLFLPAKSLPTLPYFNHLCLEGPQILSCLALLGLYLESYSCLIFPFLFHLNGQTQMFFLREVFPDSWLGLGLLPLFPQPMGFPGSESSSPVQPGAFFLSGTMGVLVHSTTVMLGEQESRPRALC